MSQTTVFTPFSESDLIPKEERLVVFRRQRPFSIGIPKENHRHERRLCLTPDAVQTLVNHGYDIIIQRGAGMGSSFTDLQYSEAGARISDDPSEVFSRDVLLMINPPTPEEIDYMKTGTYLISALQFNLQTRDYFKKLSEKKINAIAFEFILDEYKQKTLVRLIGEIAGKISILYASELMAQSTGQMLGGITGVRPTEVVIIGAGIIGESAARTAYQLGASVRIFDNSLSKLRRLNSSIRQHLPTSIIDPKELKKSLRRADVTIGALPCLKTPPVVSEAMVQVMKPGSIIIDLSIDSGPCIETSRLTTYDQPTVIQYDVVHCGLPNITSKMPRSTTKAISNFFLSYLLNYKEKDGFEAMLVRHNEMKHSFYMYKGRHTNRLICDQFDLVYHDINLLIF